MIVCGFPGATILGVEVVYFLPPPTIRCRSRQQVQNILTHLGVDGVRDGKLSTSRRVFSRVCSGTSVPSTRDVAASLLARCRGSRIFVSVAAATGFVSRHKPAERSIPDVSAAPTLRRHASRPVAAGVSLSQKDVAASLYVCSRGAATLSSPVSSFGSGSSSTYCRSCSGRCRVHPRLEVKSTRLLNFQTSTRLLQVKSTRLLDLQTRHRVP